MKLFVLCLLAAATPMLAGKLIEMDSTDLSNNQTTTRRLMIDNDRLAILDGQTKMIFRADGGRPRIQVVNLQRNDYMEIDEATMKQMTDTMAGAMAQMDAALSKMDPAQRAMVEKMMKGKMPTGAPAAAAPMTFARQGNGTVAGYSCTRYTGTQNGRTAMEVCASTAAALNLASGEYAVFEKMREFAKGMVQAVQNSPFAGMAASGFNTPGFDGFPIEQTTYANGRPTTKDTLKSIANQSFSDADFSVGNAKKTELPMGNAKGR